MPHDNRLNQDSSRPSRFTSLATAARWGATSSFIVIGLNFLTGILTARLLGPSGRAGYVTGQVWMVMAAWFCQVGLSAAARAAAARARDLAERRQVTQSALVLGAVLAIVAAVVPQPLILALNLQPSLARAASIGACFASLMLINELLCGLLVGLDKIGLVSIMRVMFPLGVVLGFGVLLSLGEVTQDTALAVLGASYVLPVIAGLAALRGTLGWRSVSRAQIASQLVFGAKTQLGTLATVANARLDLIVLPKFVSVAQVGLYGLASNLASIMQLAVSQVAGNVVPHLVRSTDHERRSLMERCVRLTLLLGALVAAIGSAVSWILLPVVYGSDFAEARTMLVILLAGSVFLAAQTVISAGLQAIDRPGISSWSIFVSLPVTLVGLAVLAPTLGGLGASIVSALAYLTAMVAAILLSPGTLVRGRRLLSPGMYLQDVRAITRRTTTQASRDLARSVTEEEQPEGDI